MNITDFLLARIAEDEAAAREAGSESWHRDGTWWLEGVNHDVVGPDEVAFTHPGYVEHIARHDPARVLAECVAKRAIVERAASPVAHVGQDIERRATLKNLAAVHADHPDYNPAWRVA